MSWKELSSVTGVAGQRLGNDVDISGNYAIVSDSTTVYKVFFYQRKSDGDWEEIDQKTVDDSCRVAISGNYAIAAFTDFTTALFYQRQSNGKWEEIDRKTGINTARVAISGSYAAIGQINDNIIIYQRQTDGKWEEIDRTADINLTNLAMDGNNIIAGNSGSRIYFYQRQSNGKWEEIDRKENFSNFSQFDYSVGISGSYAAAVLPSVNIIIFYQRKNDGTWEEIDRKAKYQPVNISIDGNYAMLAAEGSGEIIYIFYQRQTDGKWEEIDRKTSSGNFYSSRGVVSGNYAIIGNPSSSLTTNNVEGSITFYLKKTNRDYYGGSAGPPAPPGESGEGELA